MNKYNFFILSALVMGLTACGSNDDNVGHQPPMEHYPIPKNPSSGNFQSAEQAMISQLQAMYGNVTTNKHAILGTTTLPQGTHNWKSIYDRVRTAAESCGHYCQIQGYGGYSYYSPMSRIDFNRLRQYLNFNALSNVAVKYANDPGFHGYSLAHTIDQVLRVLSGTYSHMYSNWFGYGYYPIVYTPWYSGSGLSANVYYSSGGGLSVQFGAHYSN
jgi:hypothetical protein